MPGRQQQRSMAGWVRHAMAGLRLMPPGLWILSALAVIGATLLRLAAAPVPGAAPAIVGPAAAAIVQLLVLLVLNVALTRAAAGVRPVMTVGAAMLRYGLMLAATILFMLLPLAVARALLPASARLADIWLWSFVATTAGTLMLWPLAPWMAALAIGDRTLGPGGAGRLLHGGMLRFCGAYLMVVSPCFAVHLMLTMVLDVPGSTLAGSALIGVVFVDSAASLAQLVLTVGLGVAAWRLHADRQAR